ncbi:Alpha/Beta hydrolase protein [Pilobolus umbonatus]|nr:Alpha/Beta hydrolase protein [Pilobolus umbonatus]
MATKFTPPDLIQLPRPSASVPSPNGLLAVYSQSRYNIKDAKQTRSLYLLDISNNHVKELTEPSYNISDYDAFFLDDQHIAFFHQDSGLKETVVQLHVLDISKEGREPYLLTDFPIEFGNIKYNVKHKLMAFSAAVYEDGSLEGAYQRDRDEVSNKKDTAMVFDELMVRHWDTYVTKKKNNLFVVHLSINNGIYKVVDKPINVMKNTHLESPGFPQGDASDYDISPDASHIAFLSKITTRDNAWETSSHIYIVSTTGDTPVVVNGDIPAASSNPCYTPSGLLVYFQMMTPKYESDRNRIVIYDPTTGERRIVAEHWDSSPHEVIASSDSRHLYVTAEKEGRQRIFSIDLNDESISSLTEEHYASSLNLLPSGNILFSSTSMKNPASPHLINVQTKEVKPLALEHGLSKKLHSFKFSDPQDIRFTGALDQEVHGWYLKPADYEEGKSYPVAFLIHGGPQGAWTDNWSNRWNPQIFTGAGYGVIAINFHGSTGYGQDFTDSIGNNWGSHPFHDLEIGLDYVLNKYSYLDADRVAGLGASYGGYMVNWINGHSDKFKVLVNHDGVFSTTGVYYTTDELYFSEKEFGGSPIFPENREGFEKWSPSNFVQNWKTPTLVIHGGRDYRLTVCESLSTFTALQVQGIPSRLVYFPDESHWVLKPANSLKWHHEGKIHRNNQM